MPVRKSLNAYLKERLNCAQSVMRGFQEICEVTDAQIEDVKTMGHGKAEGGICGALYSAMLLAGDENARKNLHGEFVGKAGSDKCREIRSAQRLSCGECVALASSLLLEQCSRR